MLSLHIDNGVLQSVKTNDAALSSLEIIEVIGNVAVRSLRPSLEDEIIRYVGQARERSAVAIATRAFAELIKQCNGRSFESFDEAAAIWTIVKSDMDGQIESAFRLIYGTAAPNPPLKAAE